MQKCLIISFDFSKAKDGYPPVSYSIASIQAKFNKSGYIDIEPRSYDLNEYLNTYPSNVENKIIYTFKNEYINKINETSGATRTYAVCSGSAVIGYYSLAVGSLERQFAPGNIKRNTPKPIPVMILARLAVARRYAGQNKVSKLNCSARICLQILAARLSLHSVA